ncbi:MAG TPA: hypothetical protein VMJ10_29225 [Kofleriaceae bacterium]|nr:hypothetical protein [Kofleriaceae bacterium]
MQRIMASAVVVVLSVVMAVACSSSSKPKPDAALTNQAFGSDCTVVSDMSTECASGVCTNSINMLPTPVCSQKCTMLGSDDTTCPVGSMGQKCNMKGYCRP